MLQWLSLNEKCNRKTTAFLSLNKYKSAFFESFPHLSGILCKDLNFRALNLFKFLIMNNLEKEKKIVSWEILQKCNIWLYSVVKQGTRVLNLKKGLSDAEDELFHPMNPDVLKHSELFQPVEDHYFAEAVYNAIRSLRKARKEGLIDEIDVDAFHKKAFPDATIKDVNNHKQGYMSGIGERQKAFSNEFELDGEAIPLDYSCSTSQKDGYQVGGVLNVNTMIAEAKELFPKIKKIQDRIYPETIRESGTKAEQEIELGSK